MTASILQLVFVCAIAAAVGAHYERTLPRPPWSGPPAVTAERLIVHDGGASVDLTLRVHTGNAELGRVAVFWLIARPGTPRAWEAPHFMAPTKTLDGLAAGMTTDLAWDSTPLALPPGRFEITAWLHELSTDGGRRHLAGGGVGQFTVTQAVPTTLTLTDTSFTTASGPLALTSLSVRQDVPHEQLTAVEITVRNTADYPVAGRAQWTLGHFADSEAFRAAFWRTDWKEVPPLGAGEQHTLVWRQRIGLPAATYGLSAWVHTWSDGKWEHSHRSFNAPVKLQDTSMHIQRAGPQPDGVHVSAAQAEPGRVRVSIGNAAERALRVIAHAQPLPDQRRFDWFRSALEARPSRSGIEVSAGGASVIDITVPDLCVGESRLARVSLLAESATRESPPLDDVLIDACS